VVSSAVEFEASKIAPEIAGALEQPFGAANQIFEDERQRNLR
jgi:hypothetical protein